MFVATVCPANGEHPDVVARISNCIREHCLMHIAFRSDREPAIAKMLKAAGIQASCDATPATSDSIERIDNGPEDGTKRGHSPSVERASHDRAAEEPFFAAAHER